MQKNKRAERHSDRRQDAAMARKQRFKLTGKPEKPICAMESEAAGVPAASLLLFITYLFANGCLPGYKSFLKELLLPPSPSAAQS